MTFFWFLYVVFIKKYLVLSLTGCGDNARTTGNGNSAAEQSSAAENMQTEKPEERAGSVEIRDGDTVYVKTLADGSVEEGGLPLALKVTYELDGQIVDAGGIEGRSGHLKMIFDYENLTSFETEHDGRKVNVKAPVAAALTPAGDEIRRGLKELKNGTSEFADGIREFYEDGISKLTERTGEGFDEIVLRLRAVREAAASYSYPGIDGEARFIYEVTY